MRIQQNISFAEYFLITPLPQIQNPLHVRWPYPRASGQNKILTSTSVEYKLHACQPLKHFLHFKLFEPSELFDLSQAIQNYQYLVVRDPLRSELNGFFVHFSSQLLIYAQSNTFLTHSPMIPDSSGLLLFDFLIWICCLDCPLI